MQWVVHGAGHTLLIVDILHNRVINDSKFIEYISYKYVRINNNIKSVSLWQT